MLKLITIAFLSILSLQAHSLDIHRTGSPQDVIRPTHQVTCLAGGGSDDAWGTGWKYLLDNSGGGDIVIIRADGKLGGYEEWIFKDPSHLGFRPVNSVTTLVLNNPWDADAPEVEKVIQNAELIFFAGGDQNLYISWFKNSKLEKAVETAIHIRNVPIAGTSAGMALLGGISYRARFNSAIDGELLSSEEALNNPTDLQTDLERYSLRAPHLENVITETHFSERNRYGRAVGLMAKGIYAHLASFDQIKLIASDSGTAFCYNHDGIGRVYGDSSVYFMRGKTSPEILQTGSPLTWDANGKAVEVRILKNGDLFRLSDWTTENGSQSYWSVVNGVLKN